MSKNAIIFGDSYSTFAGFIPEGYAAYYSENERAETDVRKVTETWWHQVMEETGLNLVQNNSWSGSTVGYTGYNNTDTSRSSSFIYRFEKLCEDGFFDENRIDTVFVFGGTNDSWSNAPLGAPKYENVQREEMYSVLPAICYFIKSLKETLPDAEIYCLVNTDIKAEIQDCIKSACETYGATAITFDRIDKKCGHPTVKGMADIKNAVLKAIV